MRKLSEILNFIGIKSSNDKEVNRICSDSRKIKKGDLFIALNGYHHKGKEYIKQALDNGAIGVINEDLEGENIYKCIDLKNKLSSLLEFAFDLDFNKFKVIGVTGTNGKTTTTSLIYKFLLSNKENVTLIGTNGVYFNNEHIYIDNTTPNIIELYSIFNESRKRNIYTIIMEVSSHAIALNRIDKIRFDIVCFTNISHDHLDFHKTIDNYANCKLKLIQYLRENGLIIYNEDDFYFKNISKNNKNVISYGINSQDNKINNIRLDTSKSVFYINNTYIESKLSCLFNVYNLSLAYLVLLNMNYKVNDIVKGLSKIDYIDGRMQKINIKNMNIYIDFAHSPDSISKVLAFIKPLVKKKLIVIFGAGGDRDKLKRPKMLDACLKYANKIYITSDNPRYEDPSLIINEIIKNKMSCKIETFLSREDAIIDALKYSEKQDTIVILGKGNENYQIINDLKIPYSDYEVIKKCLMD